MIKNLDHNLDYTVDYCRYKDPSHSDEHVDDLNKMGGIADGNYPNMVQFVVDTLMGAVSSVASTIFDHNKSQRSLDTSVAFANYRIDRPGHCWSSQIAEISEQLKTSSCNSK